MVRGAGGSGGAWSKAIGSRASAQEWLQEAGLTRQPGQSRTGSEQRTGGDLTERRDTQGPPEEQHRSGRLLRFYDRARGTRRLVINI